MRSLLDIIYESISDSDDDIKKRTDQDLFYTNFANCFVKVFGKISRTDSKRALRAAALKAGKIGEVVISSAHSDEWYFTSNRQNGFIDKLNQMFELLEKKYPGIYYNFIYYTLEYEAVHIMQNLNMTTYTIKVYREKKILFQWKIVVTRDGEKINKISISSIVKSNPKSTKEEKELFKIIDDNI